MAEVVLPSSNQPLPFQPDFPSQEPVDSPADSSPRLAPPPTFVFPARPDPSPSATQAHRRSRTAASVLDGSSSSNPVSSGRKAALPTFSFNPASDTNQAQYQRLTPPPSPNFEIPTTPTKGGRHRRSKSEWIGSDGAIDTSATASQEITNNAPPVPPLPSWTLAPGPSLKGHRHRRSGAISASDLPLVNAPLSQPIPHAHRRTPSTLSGDSISIAETEFGKENELSSRTSMESAPSSNFTPRSKGRVTFSEIPDFAPRPLSTISSATENSTSTYRGHSITGSVSSQTLSLSTSPPHKMGSLSSISVQDPESPILRPKSAGLVAESSRKSSWSDSPSPQRELRRPISASALRPFGLDYGDLSPVSTPSRTKRLGTWASSLVGRPPKPRELRRSPRDVDVGDVKNDEAVFGPPIEQEPIPAHDDNLFDSCGLADENMLNINFDEDPTSTIETEDSTFSEYRSMSAPLFITAGVNDGNQIDSMIDINEATRVTVDSNPKSFAIARKNMHSGGRESHRRAGSAPLLPSPEFSLPSPRRFPSVIAEPALDDVFEEEVEEDSTKVSAPSDSPESPQHEQRQVEGLGIGVNIVEFDDSEMQPHSKFGSGQASGLTVPHSNFGSHGRHASWSGPQVHPLKDDGRSLDNGVAVYGNNFSTPPPTASSVSQISAVSEPDDEPFDSGPSLRPQTPSVAATSSPCTPVSPTRMTQSESPHATGFGDSTSSSALDTRPRLSQFKFGELDSDRRISVDGVPSLISSRSTMTSAIHAPLPESVTPSYTDFPSPSISSAATSTRHRKRSSIASLGRLMSGSFNARKSNLSMEQTLRCQTSDGLLTENDDSKADKKSKRMSKLLKFWKPKKSLSQFAGPRRGSASTLRTQVHADS